MRRLLPVLVWLFANSPANAETIAVRSGEHANFSRLVFQINEPRSWIFGRIDGGYELRLDRADLEFDLSNVFRFIPKQRIESVSQPGPGRMRIIVDCPCRARAFELGNGRIVIDVQDGEPDPASEYENRIPDLAEGVAWSPELLPGIGMLGLEQLPGPALMDREFAQTRPVQSLDARSGRDQTFRGLSEGRRLRNEPERIEVRARDVGGVNFGPDEPAPPDVQIEPDRFFSIREDNGVVLPVQGDEAVASLAFPLPELTDQPDIAGAEELRDALLKQIGRSSAQGFIEVASPLIDQEPAEPEPPRQTEKRDSDERPAPPAESIGSSPAFSRHFRIETAADRAANETASGETTGNAGSGCMDSMFFDVFDWAPKEPEEKLFGSLRADILEEFDKPDQDKIIELVRRNIYFGFGAEALLLLEAYDVGSKEEAVLKGLANIVDGRPEQAGMLRNQIECSGSAVFWAVLAHDRIPETVSLDIQAVLGTFSALPVHLREQFGPALTKIFVEDGDLSAAEAIKAAMIRGGLESGPAQQLLEAQLDLKDGNLEEALERLARIATGDGVQAAEATATFMELSLAMDFPISPEMTLLADAFGTEFRGTQLGNRLLKSAILAFAVGGETDSALNRIAMATEDDDIDSDTAAQLRAEVLLRITELDDDAAFLESWLKAEIRPDETSETAYAALIRAADRMIEIGLPDLALDQISGLGPDFSEEEKILMARAHVGRGEAQAALKLLSGLQSRDALELSARARELAGDFQGAAKTYEALSSNTARESAVLRSGDWLALGANELSLEGSAESLEKEAKSQGSELIPLIIEIGKNSAAGEKEAGPIGIATGKSLVEKSQRARALLKKLISTN